MKLKVNEKCLGDIVSIVDCEHKTAPYVDSSEYRVVRTSNVRNGMLVEEDLKSTTSDGFREWTQRGIPQYGDVFFTREAPAGETCMVPLGEKHCMGQRMVLLKPDKNYVNSQYLAIYLNSERCRFSIYRYSIGSTVSRINIADIHKIPILLPPLPEQKAIADLLSTWDEAIEKIERLIQMKENRFRRLLKELISKQQISTDNYECEKVILGDIITIIKGKGLSKNSVSNIGQKKCVLYGELYTKYPEIITNIESYTNSTDGEPSKAGDVLIPSSTTTTGIDLAKATALLDDDVLLGGDINILRPKVAEFYDPLFLAYYLTHIKKHEIARYAQGITIVHLYGRDICKVKLELPPLEEQKQIAETISTAQHEIDLLKQMAEKYKTQKRGLMQKMLTGEWRVKDEIISKYMEK
ncbi:restriction endonuclease subunit S [Methanococcoides sp. NM1]|uniref:restriction endonuclease subunit S n=1 Tax=Methanococcoides sp. NM1 TaxID=1201013 RepID=UPI0010838026|nr:restriction endonuclease subunit S [Methanococcoides sp. NM1]